MKRLLVFLFCFNLIFSSLSLIPVMRRCAGPAFYSRFEGQSVNVTLLLLGIPDGVCLTENGVDFTYYNVCAKSKIVYMNTDGKSIQKVYCSM